MEALDFIFFLGLFLIGILIVYKLATIIYTSLVISDGVSLNPAIAFKQFKRSKNIQESIISSSPRDEVSGQFSFRVFCASERSLSKFMNLFPWESRGVLSFDGTNIHFIGIRTRQVLFSARKAKIKVRYKFPRNQVKISFLPSSFLRDGGLEWVKMEAHKHKFYLLLDITQE